MGTDVYGLIEQYKGIYNNSPKKSHNKGIFQSRANTRMRVYHVRIWLYDFQKMSNNSQSHVLSSIFDKIFKIYVRFVVGFV